MIYASPSLEEVDLAVVDLLGGHRERLEVYLRDAPPAWFGCFLRTTLARAIQGSAGIGNNDASLDEVVAVVEDQPPPGERSAARLALEGYRNALSHVCQAAQDPHFELGRQFLKSLHFMMVGFDRSRHPGQWRPGSVRVAERPSGETVYEGPPAELVGSLVEELVVSLKATTAEPSPVKAAMAHLNMTMIHPFEGANGRMARALQTLIAGLGGTLHPALSSIEEWLGRNAQDCWQGLALTGQGRWNPGRSALMWVRFCLRGHYQQTIALIRRIEERSALHGKLCEVALREKLPERASVPLLDAALGLRLGNPRYRMAAEVSELVASRDLKRLCDAGLLRPIGEKRARTYRAAEALTALRAATQLPQILDDPYELIARRRRQESQLEAPRLPGV